MLFHVALSAICFIGMMKKAINIEINAGKSRNLIQIKKKKKKKRDEGDNRVLMISILISFL